MATVIIIVVTSVSIRYTSSGGDSDDGQDYAPTDTRIIPITNSLCQGAKLTMQASTITSFGHYNVTLYTLDSHPKLTGSESFSVTTQPNLYSEYKYYYYYMYPGSNFYVSACLQDSVSQFATFYIIKGNKNFKKWIDEPYSHYKDRVSITAPCNGGSNNSYTYHVKSEDFYYLVFDVDDYSSASLNIYMSFYRTYYELGSSNSILDFCSETTDNYWSSCSVNVRLSGSTTFLTVQPVQGTDINWLDGIDVDTSCSPRIWVYVMISLAVLVGVVSTLAVIVICVCVCVCKKKRKVSAASLVANTTGVEPAAPLLQDTSPPPTNPRYQQQQKQPYGSTFENPPAYKP